MKDEPESREEIMVIGCPKTLLEEGAKLMKKRGAHDGDCHIFSSIGICTCGYGLREWRKGRLNALASRERESLEAEYREITFKAIRLNAVIELLELHQQEAEADLQFTLSGVFEAQIIRIKRLLKIAKGEGDDVT